MASKEELEAEVMGAAGDNGIETILFRNALAKRLGLSLTESLCLTYLGLNGASTPTELARFTGLASGSTTAMLDRLEARSFLRRRPNPEDRRGLLIEVDEAYSRTASGLVAGIQEAHRRLISRFSEGELQTVADFLRGLAGNLREERAKIEDSATKL